MSFISKEAVNPLKLKYGPLQSKGIFSVPTQGLCEGHTINLDFVLPNSDQKRSFSFFVQNKFDFT